MEEKGQGGWESVCVHVCMGVSWFIFYCYNKILGSLKRGLLSSQFCSSALATAI